MKAIFSLLTVLCFALAASGQAASDPSKWTFKVSAGDGSALPKPGKAGEKAYKLEFIVELKPGWHIYSLDPGGDGTLIPPSFTFKDSATLVKDEIVESARPEEMTMEGIEGKVRYFEGKAIFFTTVSAKKSRVIKGTYTYQLCNDKMCLPPKTVPFVFRIP